MAYFFEVSHGLCDLGDVGERAREAGEDLLELDDLMAVDDADEELFLLLAACGFSLCRNSLAVVLLLRLAFPQRSRTSAQRPVFGLPAGTRSAASRKRHKLPTRARQAVTGVLSALSTCVFNKIGIFSPCRVLGKLLHLPVVVLLERELNWLDCE